MPDIVLHNEMGQKVLNKLETEISSHIDLQIFTFGLIAPDAFMSYRFFAPHFRHGINKRGAIMHECNCKEFFVEFAKQCNDDQSFSLLCGYLCHYAMDSLLHPNINQLALGRRGMHEAFEHSLDMRELKKKKSTAVVDYFAPYYNSNALGNAMMDVYGWGLDHFETAYRHLKLYYSICSDKYGVINLLFHNFKGKISSLSYRNNKCLDVNWKDCDRLIEESIELANNLIVAAYGFYKHSINEEELSQMIGNRTYLG